MLEVNLYHCGCSQTAPTREELPAHCLGHDAREVATDQSLAHTEVGHFCGWEECETLEPEIVSVYLYHCGCSQTAATREELPEHCPGHDARDVAIDQTRVVAEVGHFCGWLKCETKT